MKRTISVMVGKGSVNHNSRKFKADNVDGERTENNINYINKNLKAVYHELFDEVLYSYNEKQTRADRRIDDYYEKIRTSRQEKLFHEVILQVGNCEDMSALGEHAELAKTVLNEYYAGFQERNPNLYVFSAHLHMDEATPHLHIDFVPFTTGSKRGLETRVSLKQALAKQGFKGGTRQETEWNQWVQAEKEQLARVMLKYGIEWEQKGTHEKHLSVLEYEKKQRAQELEAIEEKIKEKQDELEAVENRSAIIDVGTDNLEHLEMALEEAPEYQLPEPAVMMSAKTYKAKYAEPLIKRLKELAVGILYKYYRALEDYTQLKAENSGLARENERLNNKVKKLADDNANLRRSLRDYKLLRKLLGGRQIDGLLSKAKERNAKAKVRL